MVISSGIAIVIAITIFFFLVPHPENIGIYVEEMTEKEVLIATATTKEVYDNVIRKSAQV
jgi:sugar phosphate permease